MPSSGLLSQRFSHGSPHWIRSPGGEWVDLMQFPIVGCCALVAGTDTPLALRTIMIDRLQFVNFTHEQLLNCISLDAVLRLD